MGESVWKTGGKVFICGRRGAQRKQQTCCFLHNNSHMKWPGIESGPDQLLFGDWPSESRVISIVCICVSESCHDIDKMVSVFWWDVQKTYYRCITTGKTVFIKITDLRLIKKSTGFLQLECSLKCSLEPQPKKKGPNPQTTSPLDT
jgi:hypothetical protein